MSIEVLEHNVQAILQHGNATREMTRNLEIQVATLKQDNEMLRTEIAALAAQVQTMQVKLYTGGSTYGT